MLFIRVLNVSNIFNPSLGLLHVYQSEYSFRKGFKTAKEIVQIRINADYYADLANLECDTYLQQIAFNAKTFHKRDCIISIFDT